MMMMRNTTNWNAISTWQALLGSFLLSAVISELVQWRKHRQLLAVARKHEEEQGAFAQGHVAVVCNVSEQAEMVQEELREILPQASFQTTLREPHSQSYAQMLQSTKEHSERAQRENKQENGPVQLGVCIFSVEEIDSGLMHTFVDMFDGHRHVVAVSAGVPSRLFKMEEHTKKTISQAWSQMLSLVSNI